MLSDPAGAVRSQFGVKRGLGLPQTRRVTFVIDTDRRILEIVRSEMRMSVHADKALEALRHRAPRR